ncbi:Serine/threonine-protein phosphatase 7 long form [Glycine soja]
MNSRENAAPRYGKGNQIRTFCEEASAFRWANLLYRVFFKNNLRNWVCFETNCNGGLIFTLIPPFLLAASMYRHCHQRYACVPPLPKAERGLGIAIHIGGTSWKKLTHVPLGIAIHIGGTCHWVSPFTLAEQAGRLVSPFVLAEQAEPKLSRHWQLRNALFSLKKKKLGSVVTMASSSSSSSHINIKSGPMDADVLWMQPKHVSEHVWNGEQDRKLHIRRAVPTYQGEEQIPEQIFPFLQQSGFGWIIKMGYLKINVSLISALIERWRPETHTFHMRCGECTITLQDVSVLLGISVDGLPLIGPTNLDWADLCEELLGVRPQEGEIKGSMVKLSWLAHNFAQINNDDNEEQVRRFARAWILRFIGGVLFVDKSSNKVSLRYLQFLRDFEECGTYAWGAAVLGFLYREMCSATDYNTKSIGGMCILLQLWAWERCPTLAPKRTPSQVENTPLGHRWLRRGNQHIGNDDVRVFRRKLDIMKRHEFVWEPYPSTVLSLLPPVCLVGSLAWYAVVPLICFQLILL